MPFPVGGGVIIPPPPPSRGVQDRSNEKSIAQDASTNPKPHLLFHLSEISGSDTSPLDSLEFLKMSLTSCGSRSGFACSISATTPDA